MTVEIYSMLAHAVVGRRSVVNTKCTTVQPLRCQRDNLKWQNNIPFLPLHYNKRRAEKEGGRGNRLSVKEPEK